MIARLTPFAGRALSGRSVASWPLGELVSALSLLCYLQGLFTNSYIIAEHDVVYFLAMSILLASLASMPSQSNEGSPWLSAAVPVIALRLTCEVGEVLPSSALSSTFYSAIRAGVHRRFTLPPPPRPPPATSVVGDDLSPQHLCFRFSIRLLTVPVVLVAAVVVFV